MVKAIAWSDLLYPGEANDFFDVPRLRNFVPDDAGYNTVNAWWLAELSRLVYRQDLEETATPLEPRRVAILAGVGLTQRAFFHDADHGTQAFLVESQGKRPFAALVFRGTDQNIRDLLCDLEIGVALGDAPCVHKGFERAFQAIWPQIEPALNGVTAPIFFAGHSLGAALATLAATQRKPVAVYTYGSPRVGNAAFCAQLSDVPIFRIVYGNDAVAVVPPEAMGFRHVGTEIRIGPPVAATSFDMRALWELWQAPPRSLADHAPINYMRQLYAESES